MNSKHAMRRIACVASAVAFGHAAAAVTPDPAGLWYDAREQGWGLNVAQQGDTVFATLFVYDSAGNPAWYVASEMRAEVAAAGLPPNRPIVSGALFPTDGPRSAARSIRVHRSRGAPATSRCATPTRRTSRSTWVIS